MKSEQIYVDPSALSCLYFHQENSQRMTQWRRRVKGPLPVTHHGRTEIINAIALAVFREEINLEKGAVAWDWLADDFSTGRLVQVDLLWRSALNQAASLSKTYSPKFGTRTLDVLHVSCALELGVRYFLSFDERQRRLAVALGLKEVSIGDMR